MSGYVLISSQQHSRVLQRSKQLCDSSVSAPDPWAFWLQCIILRLALCIHSQSAWILISYQQAHSRCIGKLRVVMEIYGPFEVHFAALAVGIHGHCIVSRSTHCTLQYTKQTTHCIPIETTAYVGIPSLRRCFTVISQSHATRLDIIYMQQLGSCSV